MATTTNFGWETPDDTDLVKDGAAAIRTALGGVDTSFVDLKGGTTGQVLAKASNTDLDFVWSADAAGIPATIVDAKGDLIAATAADTVARLAVGSNDQVLTADSTTATGLKWATPAAAGGYTLLSTTSCSGVTTTVSSISASYKHLLVVITNYTWATGASSVQVDINGSAGSNNYQVNIYGTTSFAGAVSGFPNGFIRPTYDTTATNTGGFNMALQISRYSTSDSFKMWNYSSTYLDNGQAAARRANMGGGAFNSTSAISSIGLTNNQGYAATAGTIYVYGVN